MRNAFSLSKLLTKIWVDRKSVYRNLNGTDYCMVDIIFLIYLFLNETKNKEYSLVRKSTFLYNIKKNMQEEA